MIQIIKHVIKHSPLYPLRNWWVKSAQEKKRAAWERRGRPVPPPHIVKQQTLLDYGKTFGLRVLVETGTYYGDMVEAMKGSFDHIYSVEISQELFTKAKKRFKNARNIELIHGDSGEEIRNIMKRIDQPALFWLDGHYSEGVTGKAAHDTPIYEELDHILSAKVTGHVIIIDDARCFGADPSYPTLEKLRQFVKSKKENVEICVSDDIIRITPKEDLSDGSSN